MDKINNLLEKMERFADRHWMHNEGQSLKGYVNRLRPLVEDLHSRLKLWEGRADELRKDCDRLYADRNNWMKQALAEDERANAAQPVTNYNGLEIVRKVAEEMMNISMQVITAEVICGWATRLGDVSKGGDK